MVFPELLEYPPIEPEDPEAVHANVDPATLDESATLVAVLLQMTCPLGVAVTVGVGFTVTITPRMLPEQLLAVGVMVYVAVPAVVPVLVSV